MALLMHAVHVGTLDKATRSIWIARFRSYLTISSTAFDSRSIGALVTTTYHGNDFGHVEAAHCFEHLIGRVLAFAQHRPAGPASALLSTKNSAPFADRVADTDRLLFGLAQITASDADERCASFLAASAPGTSLSGTAALFAGFQLMPSATTARNSERRRCIQIFLRIFSQPGWLRRLGPFGVARIRCVGFFRTANAEAPCTLSNSNSFTAAAWRDRVRRISAPFARKRQLPRRRRAGVGVRSRRPHISDPVPISSPASRLGASAWARRGRSC